MKMNNRLIKTSSVFVFAILILGLLTLNAEPQTDPFIEIQEIFPSDVNPMDVSCILLPIKK